MRLFYWSNSTFPTNNANIINVLYMCDAFSSKIETKLYLFSNTNLDLINEFLRVHINFKIYNLGPYSIFSLVFNFLKFILFGDFNHENDIVFTRSIYIYFISAFFNIKVHYEIHNLQRTFLHKILFYFGKRNPYSKLIFISNNLCRHYNVNINYLILPSGSIINIDKDNLRRKESYILSKFNPVRICYVGSDHPGKGVDRVYALANLLPGFIFEIVGVDNNKYNWPENCIIRGRLSSNDSLNIMSNCHIFLLPNHKKVLINSKGDIGEFTSPLKLFEYMSSYGCLIATNLFILKEVLNNNNSVLLDEFNFEEQAKNTILYLNENREKLIYFATNSYNDFIKNYTWENRANKIYATII